MLLNLLNLRVNKMFLSFNVALNSINPKFAVSSSALEFPVFLDSQSMERSCLNRILLISHNIGMKKENIQISAKSQSYIYLERVSARND